MRDLGDYEALGRKINWDGIRDASCDGDGDPKSGLRFDLPYVHVVLECTSRVNMVYHIL